MFAINPSRSSGLLPTQPGSPPAQVLIAPRPVRPASSAGLLARTMDTIDSQTPGTAASSSSSPIHRPPSRTEKRYRCTFDDCDKAYYKPSRLAEHELTHTGERPHNCPHCPQSYLRASHLTAHLRTHLDEEDKPFRCAEAGCDKSFWTKTHLTRHQAVHDQIPAYQCEHCSEAFAKAHMLRDHMVLTHLPAGTKPFICGEEGCGWSFALKHQLKAHQKTHNPTRYTCSHPAHQDDFPSFPTWSALQTHVRAEHAPTCPHRECHGRVFKSAQRLRDHLKVHLEREIDLDSQVIDEDVPDVFLDGEGPGGKRKRRRKSEAAREAGVKLRRIDSGSAGKEWACEQEGCKKSFKTKFALASHVSASHLGNKFTCPTAGCDKAFAHKSNLQRHVVSHDTPSTPSTPRSKGRGAEGTMSEITGARISKLRYPCPIRFVHPEAECDERYSRVYDVKRHLKAEHGVGLEDLQVRVLLSKALQGGSAGGAGTVMGEKGGDIWVGSSI